MKTSKISIQKSAFKNGNIKVAIVHDWLVGGGAEKVILELHNMFPEAPIYTSYATDEWRQKLDGKVVTGWLQHFGKLRKFMILPRIWWFQHLDLSEYDLIITSSGNGEAFAVRKDFRPLRKRLFQKSAFKNQHSTHINYCHTPTHYYWRHYEQYMARPGFGVFDPLARVGLKLLVTPLRRWDYKAAQRADFTIANSSHIQADIKRYYHRDAEVIFPPVDTERFQQSTINNQQSKPRSGFITAGRLATMKRVDLIVDACTELNVPLKVVGRGPDYDNLVKRGGPTVTFHNQVSDEEMPAYLSSAKAFVFASFEDFGITPIEAMATGTPVIAYQAGGALDYVVPGKTGAFFPIQTVASLKQALQEFDPSKYSQNDIKTAAERYSIQNFHRSMQVFLDKVIQ
jgi:glycosyltransferase involved in cell wall biosynthesis